MKVSLEWLKDFVPLPESADVLAAALTDGGTEVIGQEERGNIPDKVVVAQILSSEQHPNADRLSVCRVEDGSGQPRQIVCGAKNYKVGDKVPLALPGAVLGKDFKIKAGKLRGVVSDGMMCSAKELGLAEDAEGLLILPPDAPVGHLLGELFQPDTVLELEVTPNRPDLLSIQGIAREVATLTHAKFHVPTISDPTIAPAGERVQLRDEGCPFYSARLIRGVRIAPSPPWLAARLTAVGLRPINNVVDITNYVLLEMGQPLHAFDYGKLEGGIVVRSARDGEKMQALDGSDLTLRAYDLVIADGVKPVALAGVVGGVATSVTEITTDILLESAWFEPTRVRRTAREFGLQTDSSYRFERRVNPAGVLAASARAVELILQVAGGDAENQTLVAGVAPEDAREVFLDNDRCRQLLGMEIANDEISAILERLGLVASDSGLWIVPPFRPDLTREVDLIEEVIRVAGIQRVPSRLRAFPASSGIADRRHDRAEILREKLRGQGFSEARNSHFVSAESLNRAGVEAAQAMTIRNPLGAEQALLRPTLQAGLLAALAHNVRHGTSSVRLFEMGPTFTKEGERVALGIITTGAVTKDTWKTASELTDFYDLKGVVEAVFGTMAVTPSSDAGLSACLESSLTHGILQRVPREVAVFYDAKTPVFYAEVLLDRWLEAEPGVVRVKPLAKFPSVERDLAVVLPTSIPFVEIEHSLQAAKAAYLQEIFLKDVYRDASGEKLDAALRSLTITLTFREATRTLTADEVDCAVATLRDHVKTELGATFRE